jgi:hypothetical protein
MKLERILMVAVGGMLMSGVLVLATAGPQHRRLGFWLLFGGCAVWSVPLLAGLIYHLVRSITGRRRD